MPHEVEANEYQLKNSSENLVTIASCGGTSTSDTMKADVLNTKPGDIIQGKGNGFYQTMIVLSHDENSITILDCDNDYKCTVLVRTRDWAAFSKAFPQYTIYRSKNYPNSGLPTVRISPNGGSFANTQKVTITTEPANSMINIYYTTDGTAPTNKSTKYTGAFTLSESATVKAVAYLSLLKSDVTTAIFTKNHTHNWGGWTISAKPTLTATGTATRVCQSDSSHVDTYTLPNLTNSLWTKGASVAATCAAEGSQTYTSSYGSVTIATSKTEHTWGEWSYFPATPAAGAYRMRKCNACGFEQAEDIEHGDKHNSRKVNGEPATCTETGTADFWVCDDCGMEFSDAKCTTPRKNITLPALGHSWGAWKVTTPATETAAGVETRVCERCQATETRDLPVLEHTHTLVKHGTVSASCTTEGNNAYWTCSGCNKMFSDENGKTEINKVPTIAATGHKSNNGEITQAPSCTVKGIKAYKCSVCGEILKTEDIAANGHSWSKWIIETPATETNDGFKARTCQSCGEKETKSIPAISHTHTLVKHNAVLADCVTSGTDEYWTCSGCEGIFGDESGTRELNEIPVIAATGHKWNNGEITTPATTESEGIKTYTCTVCEETKTESIPKLTDTDPDTPNMHTHTYSTVWSSDNKNHWHAATCEHIGEVSDKAVHTYDGGVVTTLATTSRNGVKTYTCTVCGSTKTESIPKLSGGSSGGSHTPSRPSKPSTPVIPDTPDDPTTSDIPSEPNKPDEPNVPDTPSETDKSNVGNISKDTQLGENAFKTEITTSLDELTRMVLTDVEREQITKGTDIKIVLTVNNLNNLDSDIDRQTVKEALNEFGYILGKYLDISLFKKIGDIEKQVTETNGLITLTFNIPEELRSDGRVFAVIRVHNGETAVLPDIDDDESTVTIQTDRFSTYALVYRDPAEEPNNSQADSNNNPNTGIAYSILPAVICAVALTFCVKRREK